MIAKKANVTPGSLYNHFDSKEDIFITVHREIQDMMLGIARESLDHATCFFEALSSQLMKSLEAYENDPSLARFNAVVRIEALRNPEVREAVQTREWPDHFKKMVKLGLETGEITRDKERRVRLAMDATILGLNQHMTEGSQSANRECVRSMLELFQGNLLVPLARVYQPEE